MRFYLCQKSVLKKKEPSFFFTSKKIRYVVLPLVLANNILVEISTMQHVAMLALCLFLHVNIWFDLALGVLNCLLSDF